MRKLACLTLLLFFSSVSVSFGADVWVNGYVRSNGTYVQGYHRSAPNSTPYDNYSTKGNINPYTGKEGYKNPDW